jgi:hypothetical protein
MMGYHAFSALLARGLEHLFYSFGLMVRPNASTSALRHREGLLLSRAPGPA